MYENHRATTRFILNVAIRIRRLDQMGSIEHTVVCSNISAGGVYFSSDVQLNLDTPVRLYLMMPEQIFGRSTGRWRCEGRVIHIHPSTRLGSELGVGLSFQNYEMLAAQSPEATGEQLSLRAWCAGKH
jgi:hypothetical protein